MIALQDIHPLAIWTYGLWAKRYESQWEDMEKDSDDIQDMESLMY